MLIIQCLQTSISSLCHPIRVKFIIVYCICPVRHVQCYPFRAVTGKIYLIHKLTSDLTLPRKQKQKKRIGNLHEPYRDNYVRYIDTLALPFFSISIPPKMAWNCWKYNWLKGEKSCTFVFQNCDHCIHKDVRAKSGLNWGQFLFHVMHGADVISRTIAARNSSTSLKNSFACCAVEMGELRRQQKADYLKRNLVGSLRKVDANENEKAKPLRRKSSGCAPSCFCVLHSFGYINFTVLLMRTTWNDQNWSGIGCETMTINSAEQ